MKLDKIKNETFLIGGVEFKLKQDLTLDESEESGKLLSLFFSPSTTTVIASASAKDIKKFLSVVLERVDGQSSGNFDFGKAKESVQLRVFLFFFISRVKQGIDSANASAELIKGLSEQ
jgi:hypothetical protein